MNLHSAGLSRPYEQGRIFFLVIIIWCALIAGSIAWNWYQIQRSIVEFAKTEARSGIEEDLYYRRWAAINGGVYVQPTAKTPANPKLGNVRDHDVTTTSGKKLTLINPAYMFRQVHELGKDFYGSQEHYQSQSYSARERRQTRGKHPHYRLLNWGVQSKVHLR